MEDRIEAAPLAEQEDLEVAAYLSDQSEPRSEVASIASLPPEEDLKLDKLTLNREQIKTARRFETTLTEIARKIIANSETSEYQEDNPIFEFVLPAKQILRAMQSLMDVTMSDILALPRVTGNAADTIRSEARYFKTACRRYQSFISTQETVVKQRSKLSLVFWAERDEQVRVLRYRILVLGMFIRSMIARFVKRKTWHNELLKLKKKSQELREKNAVFLTAVEEAKSSKAQDKGRLRLIQTNCMSAANVYLEVAECYNTVMALGYGDDDLLEQVRLGNLIWRHVSLTLDPALAEEIQALFQDFIEASMFLESYRALFLREDPNETDPEVQEIGLNMMDEGAAKRLMSAMVFDGKTFGTKVEKPAPYQLGESEVVFHPIPDEDDDEIRQIGFKPNLDALYSEVERSSEQVNVQSATPPVPLTSESRKNPTRRVTLPPADTKPVETKVEVQVHRTFEGNEEVGTLGGRTSALSGTTDSSAASPSSLLGEETAIRLGRGRRQSGPTREERQGGTTREDETRGAWRGSEEWRGRSRAGILKPDAHTIWTVPRIVARINKKIAETEVFMEELLGSTQACQDAKTSLRSLYTEVENAELNEVLVPRSERETVQLDEAMSNLMGEIKIYSVKIMEGRRREENARSYPRANHCEWVAGDAKSFLQFEYEAMPILSSLPRATQLASLKSNIKENPKKPTARAEVLSIIHNLPGLDEAMAAIRKRYGEWETLFPAFANEIRALKSDPKSLSEENTNILLILNLNSTMLIHNKEDQFGSLLIAECKAKLRFATRTQILERNIRTRKDFIEYLNQKYNINNELVLTSEPRTEKTKVTVNQMDWRGRKDQSNSGPTEPKKKKTCEICKKEDQHITQVCPTLLSEKDKDKRIDLVNKAKLCRQCMYGPWSRTHKCPQFATKYVCSTHKMHRSICCPKPRSGAQISSNFGSYTIHNNSVMVNQHNVGHHSLDTETILAAGSADAQTTPVLALYDNGSTGDLVEAGYARSIGAEMIPIGELTVNSFQNIATQGASVARIYLEGFGWREFLATERLSQFFPSLLFPGIPEDVCRIHSLPDIPRSAGGNCKLVFGQPSRVQNLHPEIVWSGDGMLIMNSRITGKTVVSGAGVLPDSENVAVNTLQAGVPTDVTCEEDEDEIPGLAVDESHSEDEDTPEPQFKTTKQVLDEIPASQTFKKEDLTLQKHDLETLGEGKWINGEVLTFFLRIIEEESRDVFIFDTLLSARLKSKGGTRAAEEKWTRGINVFERKNILIPIHLENHWVLVHLDLKSQTAKWFDSMYAGQKNEKIIECLKEYFLHLHMKLEGRPLDFSTWTFSAGGGPQQGNSFDCGSYLALTAANIAAGREVRFSAGEAKQFRNSMLGKIIQSSRMQPSSNNPGQKEKKGVMLTNEQGVITGNEQKGVMLTNEQGVITGNEQKDVMLTNEQGVITGNEQNGVMLTNEQKGVTSKNEQSQSDNRRGGGEGDGNRDDDGEGGDQDQPQDDGDQAQPQVGGNQDQPLGGDDTAIDNEDDTLLGAVPLGRDVGDFDPPGESHQQAVDRVLDENPAPANQRVRLQNVGDVVTRRQIQDLADRTAEPIGLRIRNDDGAAQMRNLPRRRRRRT